MIFKCPLNTPNNVRCTYITDKKKTDINAVFIK